MSISYPILFTRVYRPTSFLNCQARNSRPFMSFTERIHLRQKRLRRRELKQKGYENLFQLSLALPRAVYFAAITSKIKLIKIVILK